MSQDRDRDRDRDQAGATAYERALDSRTFGQVLRELRESYSERVMGSGGPGMPHITLHATDLLECMRKLGYPISSAAYSEIEKGASLPRNIPGFLEAVSTCLKLSPVERHQLLEQAAYDIIRAKLDSDLAMRVVRLWRDQVRLPLASQGEEVER